MNWFSVYVISVIFALARNLILMLTELCVCIFVCVAFDMNSEWNISSRSKMRRVADSKTVTRSTFLFKLFCVMCVV